MKRKMHSKRKRRISGISDTTEPTYCGMDMSKRGFMDRWKQILAWVHAKLTSEFPDIFSGLAVAPDKWEPMNAGEKLEARLLRSILLADRAEKIKKTLGSLTLEQVFQLSGDGLRKANLFADAMADRKTGKRRCPKLAGIDLQTLLYAWKYNTIRQDKETSSDATTKRQWYKFCKKIAPAGGRGNRNYKDEDEEKFLNIFRKYNKDGNQGMKLNSAITNLIDLPEEDPNYIDYAGSGSVFKCLKRILAPHGFTPSGWWNKHCPYF